MSPKLLKLNVKCVLISIMEGWVRFVLLLSIVVLFCSGLFAHPNMITKRLKISIVDDFHPLFLERLSQYFEVDYQPQINQANVIQIIKDSEIVAVRSKINFNEAVLSQLPKLKCIARGGAGMDNIDEEYSKSKGIALLNAPEGNRDAVAEHTMGLLLSLSNNIVKGHQEITNFQFNREDNRGWEIGGKTIGIFGFGNTGTSFAKRLQGFDCKIIAYDKFHDSNPFDFVKIVDFQEIINQSDVISFHIPLTQFTSKLIDERLINQCKHGVVMINTSRGGIVNQADVLSGINSGKIKQYGTDVLENENLNEMSVKERGELSALISKNQVIVTPHVAGWTHESYFKIAEVLSQKIIDFSIKIKKNHMNLEL